MLQWCGLPFPISVPDVDDIRVPIVSQADCSRRMIPAEIETADLRPMLRYRENFETLANRLHKQRKSLFDCWILSVTKKPECPNLQQIIADLSRFQEWLAWRETYFQPSEPES